MPESPNRGRSEDAQGGFSGGPVLHGQTILVTRAADQAESLCLSLKHLGAKTIVHPVIHLIEPENHREIDRAIDRIAQFDWIVFVSTNAVRFFVKQLISRFGDVEQLKMMRIAAIGHSTSAELKNLGGVKVELVPPISNSQSLGDVLRDVITDEKLLIPRADRRTTTLTDVLTEAGIEYEELIVYHSRDVNLSDPVIVNQMSQGEIDWVTVTSAAIAQSTIRLFGENLQKSKIASISPATSSALRELGFEPTVEAESFDMQGVVSAIERYSIGERGQRG